MHYTEVERFDEHDRTVLIGDDAYKHYFSFMKNVFEQVLDAYHLDSGGRQDEVGLLQYFLVRILNTINCLGTKYSFEEDFKLKIDQSDSSYPNAYELRCLDGDIKDRQQKLETTRPREILLRELVEAIYTGKDNIQRIQHQLALRTYYENIGNTRTLFLPFSPGQLTELSPENGRYQYQYTWGIFDDTLDVPMLFQLVCESDFELTDESSNSRFMAFLKDLQYGSTYSIKLIEIAAYLDRTCEGIYPKSLKRLIVGPLYGPYSMSNNAIAPYIHNFKSPEHFALEVQGELIVSIGETQPDKTKKPKQNFAIGKSAEMILRRVSDMRQVLFVPHALGQLLHASKDKTLRNEVLKYQMVSLKKKKNNNG